MEDNSTITTNERVELVMDLSKPVSSVSYDCGLYMVHHSEGNFTELVSREKWLVELFRLEMKDTCDRMDAAAKEDEA